jgi:hypothetical protein
MDLQARNREWVHTSWIAQESKLRVKNPDAKLAHDNQKEAAQNIFECFREGIVAVTLLALPQVGKTGVMAFLAYLMTTTIDDEVIIRPENVYVISGMNEVDWREQTKKSFPDALNTHVYTRSDFSKITSLVSLENALIIIDECHIASEEKQQISSSLEKLGLNTPEALHHRNVRILQVSATPAHTLFNAERIWGDDHDTIRLQAGPKYIGVKHFISAGRIIDTASTTPKQRIESVEASIKKYDSPKYHIIRPSRGDDSLLKTMISVNGWILKTHTSRTREDTDYLFDTTPLQHTIILIKGFWRAGKRLDDKHIGVMYEGPSIIPDVNVIVQSLAGRACGNDKQVPSEQSPLIYCDKKSLQDYINWYDGNGSFENIEYQSRNLKADKDGNINVSSSFHGGKFNVKVKDFDIAQPTFDNADEALKWCSGNLTYRGSEYGLYAKEGRPVKGNTHFMYRAKPREIMDELSTRRYSDNSYALKHRAKIMPVLNEGIKYIVIYKKNKLRT